MSTPIKNSNRQTTASVTEQSESVSETIHKSSPRKHHHRIYSGSSESLTKGSEKGVQKRIGEEEKESKRVKREQEEDEEDPFAFYLNPTLAVNKESRSKSNDKVNSSVQEQQQQQQSHTRNHSKTTLKSKPSASHLHSSPESTNQSKSSPLSSPPTMSSNSVSTNPSPKGKRSRPNEESNSEIVGTVDFGTGIPKKLKTEGQVDTLSDRSQSVVKSKPATDATKKPVEREERLLVRQDTQSSITSAQSLSSMQFDDTASQMSGTSSMIDLDVVSVSESVTEEGKSVDGQKKKKSSNSGKDEKHHDKERRKDNANKDGITHSEHIVRQTKKAYGKYFIFKSSKGKDSESDGTESMSSSVSSLTGKQSMDSKLSRTDEVKESEESEPTTVDIVYASKQSRERFSLLRPKSLIDTSMSKLSTSMTSSVSSSSATITSKLSTSTSSSTTEYDPIQDLISTIHHLINHTLLLYPSEIQSMFGDNTTGLIRRIIKSRNRRNGTEFVKAIKEFNELYRNCKKAGNVVGWARKRIENEADGERKKFMRKKCAETPKFELIQHVLWQSYTRVVASHADALKNYKAFSNEVYGEVNPIFVKELVEKTGITRDSVFVDLGSGIGNVVLQVAAQTGCEAHGIEIMEKPAQLGIQQQKEFEARMKFFNKPFGKIHLYQGDMTQSGAIDRVLSRCDVIFVNNYVFSPTLNQQLLHKFLDLKEGSKIVSLKSFVPVDHKITIRNVDAVENILVVKEEMYYEEWVSWSAEGGKWYIHTVDRSRLKAFLEEMSGGGGGRSSRRGG